MNFSLRRQWAAPIIVIIYALFGCLWILLSDRILIGLVKDKEALSLLQTYKGWFFVVTTAVVLYALIQRSIRRTREIETVWLESGRRYDELVENAGDCIFTLDEAGNFTAINRTGEKLTGYPRKEILRLNFADLAAPSSVDFLRRLDPQNAPSEASIDEIEIVGRNGRPIFLEVSSRQLKLPGGRTCVENIARDITQRRAFQKALQESELR